MKIKVVDTTEKKEKVFHQFKLEFLIEDESDLEDLAVRFNINVTTANTHAAYDGHYAKPSDDLWDEINAVLKQKPYMK